MKRIGTFVISAIMSATFMVSTAFANPVQPVPENVPVVSMEQAEESASQDRLRQIDSSGKYDLTGYQLFSKSFKMDGVLGIGDAHNAFNVKITPEGGPVTVICSDSNGWSWESSVIRGTGSTITILNCSPGVTYTVTVKGAELPGLHWVKYTITSYTK